MDPFVRQVMLGSARWFIPPNAGLFQSCALRPLDREAASSDEAADSLQIIAFPVAVRPRSVIGQDPLALKRLFFSPLVVRLHYVAQLATTYLRANIDARHCRLSHALGTLCTLSYLCDMLVARIASDPKIASVCMPTTDEVIFAFTYAALHDAFQGPFGHTLDALREELIGGLDASRRLDKTLLNFIVGSALELKETGTIPGMPEPPKAISALCEVLDQAVAAPLGLDTTALLRWVHNASLRDPSSLSASARERRRQLGWLYSLLEGPVDADRWDYLWRDTLHLGFTRDHDLISELLRDFCDDLRVHWDGEQSRLTVSQPIARRLDANFFALRNELYRNVYENPEKRIIDGILLRCIYLGLLRHAPKPARWPFWAQDFHYFEFLLNFVHLTDADLLSILEQIDNPLLALFARDIRTYPAIRLFWQMMLPSEEIKTTLITSSQKLTAFKYTGIQPPSWASPDKPDCTPAERVIDALTATKQHLLAQGEVATIGGDRLRSLLLHCSILPKRPARVLQFERLAWKLVKALLAGAGIVELIHGSFLQALATTRLAANQAGQEDIASLLDECPPLFVSFPWIASLSEMSISEMSREPDEETQLYVRTDNGHVQARKAKPLDNDPAMYVAVAGYPLHATSQLNPRQIERFEFAACWALNLLLDSGCELALPRDLVTPEMDSVIIDFLSPAGLFTE